GSSRVQATAGLQQFLSRKLLANYAVSELLARISRQAAGQRRVSQTQFVPGVRQSWSPPHLLLVLPQRLAELAAACQGIAQCQSSSSAVCVYGKRLSKRADSLAQSIQFKIIEALNHPCLCWYTDKVRGGLGWWVRRAFPVCRNYRLKRVQRIVISVQHEEGGG